MRRKADLGVAVMIALGVVVSLLDAEPIRADGTVDVPVDLQVELLGRVMPYERSTARASGPLRVLIVSKRGHAVSTRTAAQLSSAFRRTGTMMNRPVQVDDAAFDSWAGVREKVTTNNVHVVYIAPGLEEGLGPMAETFAGQRVLTVSAVGDYVSRGAVLGFEIASSRPRIVVNLPQARRQQLDFSAQLLRLARVVQ